MSFPADGGSQQVGQGPRAPRLEDIQSNPLSLWPFLLIRLDQQRGRTNVSLGVAEGPEGQDFQGPWIKGQNSYQRGHKPRQVMLGLP